jgi:hypothetical protein
VTTRAASTLTSTRHRATLRLSFATGAAAAQAMAALQPDDQGLVGFAVEGAALVVTAEAPSMMGLLRTLEDVLVCVRATGLP